MLTIILSLFSSARRVFQTRAALQVEILALRHQLLVLQHPRRGHRLRLSRADRSLWVALTIMERLAIGIGHRPTRDGHHLASKGTPAVLELTVFTLHLLRLDPMVLIPSLF